MSLKTCGPLSCLKANFFKGTSDSKDWAEETDGNSGLAIIMHCSLRRLKMLYDWTKRNYSKHHRMDSEQKEGRLIDSVLLQKGIFEEMVMKGTWTTGFPFPEIQILYK